MTYTDTHLRVHTYIPMYVKCYISILFNGLKN